MTNYHCMPDLSPEEIRKISEAAVASVAAKKIVTNSKHITKSASLAGKVMAKQANVIKKLSGTGSSAIKINKAFTDSVLTQSKSRKYFQEAFIQVRKTIKV
ncbi:hypothetical protein [Escherichia coli]|uniref:hypothetical protein n=1 Tax=Escherichia coli TaxID=562 RepID=UPI0005AA146E|nr:hypothetical protein [Escherichia coli]EAC2055077.1 hypothetical protein [Escherichia coli]EFF1838570.1 hypothetical protein [Escherichia coli]EFH5762255.1 hypothetical protein [Escherichia coli]EFI5217966.1 hypothetical protein [Escherichia coli]EFM4670075.1 hypothetical protein [Escherichia coli]